MVQIRNNTLEARNVDLEIMLVLIKGKAHLREIARNITLPHSTVLRRLNFLANFGVLDFSFEGKNKVFFIKKNLLARNYVCSAEFYKLSNFLNKYGEMGIIFNDILKKIPKGVILLFGSYAKDNPKEDSDIDIYAEDATSNMRKKLQEMNSKISVKIGSFNKENLLIKEIIKNHIIIRGVEEYYEKLGFFK